MVVKKFANTTENGYLYSIKIIQVKPSPTTTMEKMTITQTAERAMNILKSHDFHYEWVERGYEMACYRAKQSMKLFVKVTNELPDALREAFRNLWMAAYHCARSAYDELEQKRAEMAEAKAICENLMAELAD